VKWQKIHFNGFNNMLKTLDIDFFILFFLWKLKPINKALLDSGINCN